MNQFSKLAPLFVAVSLTAGAAALSGSKSGDNDMNRGSSSGPTDSGTGGGNGSYGSSPANAMHSNPADTQPAK